jgi:putative resolvase
MANTYLIGEFSKLIGKTVSTLQRWDREGTLIAFRTPSGRRFYTHEQYLALKGHQSSAKAEIVTYCRITDVNHTKSLEYQHELIKKYCTNEGLQVDRWLQDIGSAMSADRFDFIRLVELIEIGNVSKIIVAHEDRLLRIGFDWMEMFCTHHGATIIVLSKIMNLNVDLVSPLEEMEQDFNEVLKSFERLKNKNLKKL